MTYQFLTINAFANTAGLSLTYFFREHGTDRVKIGWTENVAVRIRDERHGNPRPLRVIALIEGNHEAELHARFAARNVRAEWHRFTREMDRFVGVNLISLPETQCYDGIDVRNPLLQPRLITNKYEGWCSVCRKLMRIGERIWWLEKSMGAHKGCYTPPTTQKEVSQ